MLVQVNAYVVGDQIQVSAARYERDGIPKPWSMLVVTSGDMGHLDETEPHDVLWRALDLLQEHETWRARPE